MECRYNFLYRYKYKKVIPKYIYYWLSGQHLERLNKAEEIPSLTQSILNKVKIPLPPLLVQEKLVRILDNFTELTARKKTVWVV